MACRKIVSFSNIAVRNLDIHLVLSDKRNADQYLNPPCAASSAFRASASSAQATSAMGFSSAGQRMVFWPPWVASTNAPPMYSFSDPKFIFIVFLAKALLKILLEHPGLCRFLNRWIGGCQYSHSPFGLQEKSSGL